ncbi:hypothetical protein LTR95_005987 [Oleoguttula sp. CCFEE 5521]
MLVESVLGISFEIYCILHRVLGWICVIQGVGHWLSYFAAHNWRIDKVRLAMAVCLGALGLLSLLRIRRSWHAVFHKVHVLLALSVCALLSLLDLHLPSVPAISLLAIATCWILAFAVWALRLVRHNHANEKPNATIEPLEPHPLGEYSAYDTQRTNAVRVVVKLSYPLVIEPGSYIFLRTADTSSKYLGLLQAYRYFVTRSDRPASQRSTMIELIAVSGDRFSQRLRNLKSSLDVIVDGVYGSLGSLAGFDKVLLLASGSGILAHLVTIRDLLHKYNARTTRTRRIELIWLLDTEAEGVLAEQILTELRDVDRDRILLVMKYLPYPPGNPDKEPATDNEQRDVQYKGPLIFKLLYKSADSALSGDLLLICGSISGAL